MDDSIIQKFRDKFLEEAYMLLDKFEKDILDLEKDTGNRELQESVFRAMHTIKGISAMYGFDYISEFTHVLENIFQSIRDGKIAFTKEIGEISLDSIDHIRQLLADEKLTDEHLRNRHQKLMGRINEFATTRPQIPTGELLEATRVTAPKAKKIQTWYVIINASEQMFYRGIFLPNIIRELSGLGSYRLNRLPVLNDSETDGWGVVLATDANLEVIQEALLFIEDNSSIIKLADFDIFDTHHRQDLTETPNDPSILDLIENKDVVTSITKGMSGSGEREGEKMVISQQQSKRISVDTVKLDNLMYLVSQLITLNTQLNEATRKQDYEKQCDYVEILESLSKQFRNSALEIRLVPISDIALRFQRLIRDLSKSLGKKIEFLTDGIDNELDKNTIDGIVEPIMHIIRNCIDHGIEEPHLRKQAGKPETGTISLSANYSGNYIYITISDDGNGIDLEKIRQKAIEKGLLTNLDKPTEKELYDLIFLPGFSTAQSLSEVSGRGVGMDIVRRRIADLHGSVSLESRKGEGTRFIIKISQSMAIIDTLLFKVEGDFFILPVAEISVCDQIDSMDLANYKHKSAIPYNNELIPLIDLRKILNIGGSYKEQVKSIVVHNGQQYMAILADSIVGEHQAVLKPLHKTYDSETFISSVSQLGNGKIAFLIDAGELNKQVVSKSLL